MPTTSRPDLLLPADPGLRALSRQLYALAAEQPIISPHGHVDPALLAEDRPFPDPSRLIIVPDHYLTRMLLSQGVPPAELGVPTVDGSTVETDGRTIWRRFVDGWHLFRGTPSRLWLERTLTEVFGVDTPLSPATADAVYDEVAARLAEPEFRPRALFDRFRIEVLATTESPLDDLAQHAKLAADGWGGPGGKVVTTFRPDNVVDMEFDNWADNVERLGEVSGEDTGTYAGFLAALRRRREAFIAAGATSSDHGHPTARTLHLSGSEAAALYERGRRGAADAADAEAFRAHMLLEFARMSIDDGLVMQLHPGSVRNHNRWLYARHGRDVGGDIPQATEYLHALTPLLDAYGNDPGCGWWSTPSTSTPSPGSWPPRGRLRGPVPRRALVVPGLPEVLRRFREAVTETAGFYNTAGFVDDTRAFCSIPVRHDVARRVDAGFLARLVAEHRLTEDEAAETIVDLAYRLPKRVFKIGEKL